MRVLAANSLDRFDHWLESLKTLKKYPEIPIFLTIDCHENNSMSQVKLLPKQTENFLMIDTIGSHCGIVHLGSEGGKCKTDGLEWDLKGDENLGFGHGSIQSTCNLVRKNVVKVTTGKDDLLWTCKLKY